MQSTTSQSQLERGKAAQTGGGGGGGRGGRGQGGVGGPRLSGAEFSDSEI